jgi:hypothetical protein
MNGAGNPAWRGGISRNSYSREFRASFKRLIRERDGNRCQRCGKTEKQNKRTLPIHHIDHDRMNCDPINLVTVCTSCNIWLAWHRDDPVDFFPKRRMLLT